LKETADHFVKKGFLYKDSKENCTGYLYYDFKQQSQEILLLAGFAHTVLFQAYPFNFQSTFNHMKGTSLFNFKLEYGDSSNVTFSYKPIKLSYIKDFYNKSEPITRIDGTNTFQVKHKNSTVTGYIIQKEQKEINTRMNMNALFNLTGGGLHRHMEKIFFSDEINKTQIKFKSDYEENCDILLLDLVSEQTYVDQDEIRKVPYMVILKENLYLFFRKWSDLMYLILRNPQVMENSISGSHR